MRVHSVVLVGLHALSEEVGDPLGDVQLILLVVFGTQLQHLVYQSADTDHRRLICQMTKREHGVLSFERVNQNIHKKIQNFELSEVSLDLQVRNSVTSERVFLLFNAYYVEHEL